MVSLKSHSEIELMRAAGRVVARTLRVTAAAAVPGASLIELDRLAADTIRAAGAEPNFLGQRPHRSVPPFPGVLCLSVNDRIVHGVPDDTVLREGDLLSIDGGAAVRGYHADAAITVEVGKVDAAATRLSQATKEGLDAGIAQMIPGARLGDISYAIQEVAKAHGYGILHGHGGHGIGTSLHEDPHVANEGRPGRGYRLREGLVLAIEPMYLEGGTGDYRILPDQWTLATADGRRAAHFEHTVAITADGPQILTQE